MKHAQLKGKNYEREISKRLSKDFKCKVRRVPLSGGIHDFMSQDIICIDRNSILNELHIECKHQEKLNFWQVYTKTKSLANVGKIPVIIATKNFYEADLVTLSLSDFTNLLLELEELRLKNGT